MPWLRRWAPGHDGAPCPAGAGPWRSGVRRAVAAGALRTVPLAGELTASLINRAADRYGLPAAGVLRLWT